MTPMRKLVTVTAVVAFAVAFAGACRDSGSDEATSARPPTSPTVAPGTTTPTLRILSPRPGDTVTAPVQVRYEVTGFRPGLGLAVFPGDVAGYRAELPLEGPAGTVVLDDKAFSGRRDLLFALEGPDHVLIADAAARVSVAGVVIQGDRSADALGGSAATATTTPAPVTTTAGVAATTVTTAPPAATGPAPALRILAPTAGQTLPGVLEVTYDITGYQPGMALAVFTSVTADGFRVDVPLNGAAGTVTVDNKALSGLRDLTIALVGLDGGLRARVTVPGVVIQGGR